MAAKITSASVGKTPIARPTTMKTAISTNGRRRKPRGRKRITWVVLLG